LVSINRIPNEPTRRRPGTDLARLLAELASLRAGLAERDALLAKQDAALAERAKEILGLQNTMDALNRESLPARHRLSGSLTEKRDPACEGDNPAFAALDNEAAEAESAMTEAVGVA